MNKANHILTILTAILCTLSGHAQTLIAVADGWAGNSVNATVFRKNSLVTYQNTQFIAYYNADGYVVLGKRRVDDTKWTLNKTQYKGNVTDAHNTISIMVDGNGYLHIAWDHHGNPLRYAKSITPLALELGEQQPMSGEIESNVTYPEFFRMPNGDLIFMYRDGQSGQGNLVLNHYDVQTKKWTQVQKNLIDGEGKRNAYWQACVDNKGTIHLSWVWRETWDVATNHDLCYAKSDDGGKTWQTSEGKKYTLPINASIAEYICNITQNSELINQTSMTADNYGNPYIATYWREQSSSIPQYHIVYKNGKKWSNVNLGFRQTPFSLKGGGTKRIPISRPQLAAKIEGKNNISLILLFRDEERGTKVSMATCNNINKNKWDITDLTDFSVGSWEPSYDTELWRDKGLLHVFIQNVEQVDGEGKSNIPPQQINVLEINNK